MFNSLDIQERMEMVGSDGKHVGTVDHKEGGDRVMLTKDDPKSRSSAQDCSAVLRRSASTTEALVFNLDSAAHL